MTSKNLFSPVRLGALELPNRILMAPLTRCRADADNAPHALNAKYYEQRASAGLIISEATQVTPYGQGYPATPGIYSDKQVAGWKVVTDAVHKAGGKIVLQLWHVGRISHPDLQPGNVAPVAPSAITPAGNASTLSGPKPYVTPRALAEQEVPEVIAQFRQGAENAKRAGFDGVEVHAANGYLIDQFLRDGSNKRTDAWGGSIENRARFALEITKQVIEVWGSDRVGIRLSPTGPFNDMHDSNPQATFGYLLRELSKLNLSYVHIIERQRGDAKHGEQPLPLSFYRETYKGNLVLNGGFDLQRGNEVLAEGLAEAVAFGQLFISNPDLPARFKTGAALNEADVSTFYGGAEKGYTDYPALSA